eukprot:TRINITY_DN22056_c0_g1_i5.p1 TRINITY_DN22056_c0_g1~~TRINITY_DN22056_c0_g1_i5.p1  ORF type:complete len:156 (-),score=28.71 TRINITY_DN22056_c0_g1_i5:69-536(-)
MARPNAMLQTWAAAWRPILQQGWKGATEARFAKADYWEEFYTDAGRRHGTMSYEWGGGGAGYAAGAAVSAAAVPRGVWRLAARGSRAVQQHLGEPGGIRALHAGCGTSGLGAALAQRAGWSVTNADFSEAAVSFLEDLHRFGPAYPRCRDALRAA